MLLALAAALAIAALGFTFFLRPQDVHQGAGATPWKHLEGRKASIYENLRDLQFEYRLGKLSDDDYQRTKTELQSELAKVLAEIDEMKAAAPAAASAAAAPAKAGTKKSAAAAAPAAPGGSVCPHCSAKFDKALKFCGECGKPMLGVSA